MDLNITRWYVRLFFGSLGIWDKFWWDGYHTSYEHKQKTNLCHFARVICVCAPLVLALHAFLYLAAVLVLIVLPIRYFGSGIYLPATGILLGCILILAVKAFKKMRHEQKKTQPPRPYVKKQRKPEPWGREPGILQIISAWLTARKKQICPIVNFYEPSEVSKDA